MASRHRGPQSTPVITLYDTPAGHSSQAWAPNVWRIRLILNYKRLRYRTIWLEFPDVEMTLRAIAAPPSAVRSDESPVYTLPVIVDATRNPSSPTIISNTNNIAEYLESTYPARPVYPEGSRALQTLFAHYIQEIFAKPLLAIMVPLSYQRMGERSQTHFASQIPAPSGPHRERAWGLVKEQFDFLAAILDKNVGDGDGICAMGYHVTYADFALCSVLLWIERMAPQDGWARVREWNGGRWARLKEKCREYMDVL
ncbi:hypothetical protein C8J56DRAFT_1058224 [Mycena floridula]|nr:hypothetical protein C8J56DRAFT_1064485 [Mycena floridula]KAJ7580585.1 hypothetical protein C8J56DRAFT_1058224 [Mycena floridula]